MNGLWVAIGFLTRLPVPTGAFEDPAAQARSLAWYPFVGLLIGLLLCLLSWCLPRDSAQLSAAILVVAWVLLTGGLHLDGLADSADAWVGGMGDRERTLAIMKDPRCGPAGVSAVVLVLLLKFAALATLLGHVHPGFVLAALVFAPLLARAALTGTLLVMPYVREKGMGHALPGASRPACLSALAMTVLACLAPGLVALPQVSAWLMPGVIALVATGVTMGLCLRACWTRIGGVTGDTCGALTELVEVAVLVALACWIA